jgi:hypothetical protein
MKKANVILVIVTCAMLLSSKALAETPASSVSSQQTMANQGQLMIQQGDDLIKQGVTLKENGQKLIQQSGVQPTVTTGKATVTESTIQTTTVTPAKAPPASSNLLDQGSQYGKYVQQGQQIWKGAQQMIPAGK